MNASYPIRPVTGAELPGFIQAILTAFNSPWPADEILALDKLVIEPERTLAALDGGQITGTAAAYSFELTVPGGSVRSAGISLVSVLPTYRRRGILSALMRRQLADVSAEGEPVAALFASEAAIYGRFGYGSAASGQNFTIRRSGALLRATGQPDAPRLVQPELRDAVADLTAVYDAVRRFRPGMISRNSAWWQVTVADPGFMRDGRSPLRCVVAAGPSGPRGYALYSGKADWDDDNIPSGTLWVRELFATDPAACAALWSDLLSRDLVSEVNAALRPDDDPLPHLLADPRQVRSRVSDGLWIRIVDLPSALCRRRYACPVDVVFDVTDSLLPHNEGRWRLQAGGLADPAVPTCERTSREADLALGIAELGAVYLGGTRLGALAAAGLVHERSPGAIAELSAAMSWDPAPWSPLMF